MGRLAASAAFKCFDCRYFSGKALLAAIDSLGADCDRSKGWFALTIDAFRRCKRHYAIAFHRLVHNRLTLLIACVARRYGARRETGAGVRAVRCFGLLHTARFQHAHRARFVDFHSDARRVGRRDARDCDFDLGCDNNWFGRILAVFVRVIHTLAFNGHRSARNDARRHVAKHKNSQ